MPLNVRTNFPMAVFFIDRTFRWRVTASFKQSLRTLHLHSSGIDENWERNTFIGLKVVHFRHRRNIFRTRFLTKNSRNKSSGWSHERKEGNETIVHVWGLENVFERRKASLFPVSELRHLSSHLCTRLSTTIIMCRRVKYGGSQEEAQKTRLGINYTSFLKVSLKSHLRVRRVDDLNECYGRLQRGRRRGQAGQKSVDGMDDQHELTSKLLIFIHSFRSSSSFFVLLPKYALTFLPSIKTIVRF